MLLKPLQTPWACLCIGTSRRRGYIHAPCPLSFNVLNGGKRTGNDLAIQEFMIEPTGAKSFSDVLRLAAETYHAPGKILRGKYGAVATKISYEECHAPPLSKTRDALDAILGALDTTGYGGVIKIGLDSAASSFYADGSHVVDEKHLSPSEMIDYYTDLGSTHPIISRKDSFEDEAYEDFVALTKRLPNTIIVGDDHYVTNPTRLEKGIKMHATNALLLKLNQIGSFSDAFDTARMDFRAGFKIMASHRSAETEVLSLRR